MQTLYRRDSEGTPKFRFTRTALLSISHKAAFSASSYDGMITLDYSRPDPRTVFFVRMKERAEKATSSSMTRGS
jgi:hypothetical protein